MRMEKERARALAELGHESMDQAVDRSRIAVLELATMFVVLTVVAAVRQVIDFDMDGSAVDVWDASLRLLAFGFILNILATVQSNSCLAWKANLLNQFVYILTGTESSFANSEDEVVPLLTKAQWKKLQCFADEAGVCLSPDMGPDVHGYLPEEESIDVGQQQVAEVESVTVAAFYGDD